ncbi:hypothetical protein DICPUDRAFT_148427 [Dictyostelium purpureum]|uniref:non-specific serine/threonine protein kinase n=1 Tax=Dictyostelium purpureum TaxID=5786 RepID=F0ZB38_DICPU|nr:uncharacterized protein DICPUDRAFT_148427 [Dictyostelium purpureum]EGC38851.1 hypothetical protein DICPUDRAFT_148427 [Dictyostelium purpureum]|eukprot:XP_003284645.1 hypothetical protein DICPUDRAFT_148427 [Dictyostelium purpureum]
MDLNLIKRYIENDLPDDKEQLIGYYTQLKQILNVLSDQKQQQINGTNNNNFVSVNFEIIESIEEKMKTIESTFNDVLNLSENSPPSPMFISNNAGNEISSHQPQSGIVIDGNNKTNVTAEILVDNNHQQQQQKEQQQVQQQVQPQHQVQQNSELTDEQKQAISRNQQVVQQAISNMEVKKRSSSHRHSGPPEIPPEEIKFDSRTDLLGGGAYGKVYKATCRGKKVAVKVPKKQTLSESELKSFKNEVDIMRNIFHPNVVLFLGACTKPGKVMIVSELMQTDLEKYIHSDNPPPFYQRMKMCLDASLGINWLHGICNVIHRDLKLANLMISKDKTVKIGDFGFSQVIKTGTTLSDQKGPKGTALYMAPEVMMKQEFNEKADVYSFGLILYEMATCEELFPEYSEIDPFYDAICNKKIRPIIPSEYPVSLKSLISRCWDHDPNKRPSFNEITQRMEDVLVDVAISNEAAARFWKNNLTKSEPDTVKWSEFVTKLSHATSVQLAPLRALKKYFCNTSLDENISIEKFDMMNKWFGNFFDEKVGPSIINEMIGLLDQQWFHDITRDTSEKRLRGRSDGTFLIRLSSNDPVNTPFTISKNKNSKPVHKRVSRDYVAASQEYPLGYKISVPLDGNVLTFNSIITMVRKLREIGNLGNACPPSEINVPYIFD